jgi:hypothetical protein
MSGHEESGSGSKVNWGTIVVSLVCALIVAIVTSWLNFRFSSIQWTNDVRLKKVEARIALMGDVANTVYRYMSLKRDALRYMWLLNSEASKLGTYATLRQKEWIEGRVQQSMPYEYKRHCECKDLLPSVRSKLLMAEVLFGPKTKEKARQLRSMVDQIEVINVKERAIEWLKERRQEGKSVERFATYKPNGAIDQISMTDAQFAYPIADELIRPCEDLLGAMHEEIETFPKTETPANLNSTYLDTEDTDSLSRK